MKKVIGFGALNVDNIFQVENLLLEENPAYPIDVQAGGSAANTIIGLAKLDIPCGFVGIVATDAYGKLLISEFKNRKVDVSNLVIKKSDIQTPSGLVEAYVDRKGRRLLFVKPGVNSMLEESDIDINYIKKNLILHLSSFVDDKQLEIQNKIISKLPKDLIVSFSPGSLYVNRGLRGIRALVERADILFLDRKEIYQLTGKGYRRSAISLLNKSSKTIIVTLGEEGCFVATRKEQFQLKTRKVKAVDTTGAGDAFAAGFLYGLAKGQNIHRCAEIGNALASISIKRVGSRAGLPNIKELSAIVSLPV